MNYINNKDFLVEIAKSKVTYSSFTDKEKDAIPDLILRDINLITESVEEGRAARAKRLAKLAYDEAIANGNKMKQDEFTIDPESIDPSEVVFRVMMWDHIPIDTSSKKTVELDLKGLLPATKTNLLFEESELITEIDIDVEKIVEKIEESIPPKAVKYVKVNFPPFQHFRVDENLIPYNVGKSHWKGDLTTGVFSKDHGRMTHKLAQMFIMLCDRYASRGNWRGYCVDETTEALTQRGWLNLYEINEDDTIMSYENSDLKWSKIKSIFRDEYDGLMHKLTVRGMDSLITPGHKLVTDRGLIKVEQLLSSDRIVLMGQGVTNQETKLHSDALVELVGWIITEGNYEFHTKRENREIKTIRIYQNHGIKADRIRSCLEELGLSFTEHNKSKNICFYIHKKSSMELCKILPIKNLNMDFILSLTNEQRELLIDTMIDGDGWRSGKNKEYRHYVQKDKTHIDLFQTLCAISGYRTNTQYCEHISFGKKVNYYNINLFTTRSNVTKGENINFHGGNRNGQEHPGQGKEYHPNEPTTYYKGMVWCPETEYGSFVARRNGTVYLTGNTYNDEMRGQALLQLSKVGLQFDESKSNNPFAFYTTITTHSFYGVLNTEKRNQTIRDDILEMNNLNPSYTRQGEWGGYSDE